MKKMVCEICGSKSIRKNNDVFVCLECGTEYTFEESKKLLIEIGDQSDDINILSQSTTKKIYNKDAVAVEEDINKTYNSANTIGFNSKPEFHYVKIKKVFTKEKFLENVVLNFLLNEATPNDIFDAEFSVVEEFELEAYAFLAEVEGSYSASVGYDRQEEYTTTESKYVREGESYIRNGVIKRASSSSSYLVDVRKTRTITDWQPFSSYLQKTNKSTIFTKDNFELSTIVHELICNPEIIKNPENVEFLDFNEYGVISHETIKAAESNIKSNAIIGLYPGDRYKNNKENFNVDITSCIVCKIPCYKLVVKYNDQEIITKGLALDNIEVVYNNPTPNEETDTIEKISKRKIKSIECAEKKYRWRKFLLFSPIISFILFCIGISNTAYEIKTRNVIFLLLAAVLLVGSLVLFFYLKAREEQEITLINNIYEFKRIKIKLNKINKADEFLKSNNLPELDLETKNLVVENYEEEYNKYLYLKTKNQYESNEIEFTTSTKEKVKLPRIAVLILLASIMEIILYILVPIFINFFGYPTTEISLIEPSIFTYLVLNLLYVSGGGCLVFILLRIIKEKKSTGKLSIWLLMLALSIVAIMISGFVISMGGKVFIGVPFIITSIVVNILEITRIKKIINLEELLTKSKEKPLSNDEIISIDKKNLSYKSSKEYINSKIDNIQFETKEDGKPLLTYTRVFMALFYPVGIILAIRGIKKYKQPEIKKLFKKSFYFLFVPVGIALFTFAVNFLCGNI